VPEVPAPPPDDLVALARRVNAGDAEAARQFARHLADPGALAAQGGDLVAALERALLARLGKLSRQSQLLIRARLARLRQTLAGSDASPLIQLLADRTGTCWLHVHVLETEAALANTPSRDARLQALTDRAHRRYLAALKALAAVRRMALPALQLNVAREQKIVLTAGVPFDLP
jgi:hypothetical protein